MHARTWVPLAAAAAAATACRTNEDIALERAELQVYATNAQNFYDAGQYDRAEQQLRKALDLDADYPKANVLLGFTLFQKATRRPATDSEGPLAEAEKALKTAAREARPSDVIRHRAYFGLGLLSTWRAKSAAREAEKIEADRAAGRLASEADLEEWRRRETEAADRAVGYYQDALLAAQGVYDDAREHLAWALAYRGRYDESLRHVGEYLQRKRDKVEVLVAERGKIAQDKDLSDRARGERTVAMEGTIAGEKRKLLQMLDFKADVLGRLGRDAEVEETVQEILRREPDYFWPLYRLALAQARAGRRREAADTLTQYLRKREDAEARLVEERATAEKREGGGRTRLEEIEKRLEDIRRERERVPVLLAVLAARDGRYGTALDLLDSILIRDPESFVLPLRSAVEALNRGKGAAAREGVARFLATLAKTHPDFHDVRGEAEGLRDDLAKRGVRG